MLTAVLIPSLLALFVALFTLPGSRAFIHNAARHPLPTHDSRRPFRRDLLRHPTSHSRVALNGIRWPGSTKPPADSSGGESDANKPNPRWFGGGQHQGGSNGAGSQANAQSKQLFVPAINPSTSDWREFRARLVAGSQGRFEQNSKNMQLMKGSGWIHSLENVEKGCLLMASPRARFNGDCFDHSVVLVLSHDPDLGSVGVILNYPLFQLGHQTDAPREFQDCWLCYGGPVGTNDVILLHSCKDIPEAKEVVKGIYQGGDPHACAERIRNQKASPNDFRFFLQFAAWAPGQLEQEVNLGWWVVAAPSTDLIWSLPPGPKQPSSSDKSPAIWKLCLQQLGGDNANLAAKSVLDAPPGALEAAEARAASATPAGALSVGEGLEGPGGARGISFSWDGLFDSSEGDKEEES
ncbi:unnamed protein product [Vitrella brassicaformis CCMP3155]|uniref:Uncharacterized protein n=1 Tax=Vitrella brassicaformis (strain CCMP3155) TaxID=1169540 RepID=A0A0G4F538_VITBC|nr:unnamed protein product [Vitrella brassicaformis CCMP3155]|eukprot:CEM06947.1 unnamed protein product [Vitrella brassicaformis CCMP3155]